MVLGTSPGLAGRAGVVLQAELDPPQQLLPSCWRQVPALGQTSGAGAISHPFEEQLLLPPANQSTAPHC